MSDHKNHLPSESEDYLKRYFWRLSGDGSMTLQALVTFRDMDIFLELVDRVPRLLEPESHPDVYYKFRPVSSKVAKYVRTWTKSGFYKSMYLKEFLDAILPPK